MKATDRGITEYMYNIRVSGMLALLRYWYMWDILNYYGKFYLLLTTSLSHYSFSQKREVYDETHLLRNYVLNYECP